MASGRSLPSTLHFEMRAAEELLWSWMSSPFR